MGEEYFVCRDDRRALQNEVADLKRLNEQLTRCLRERARVARIRAALHVGSSLSVYFLFAGVENSVRTDAVPATCGNAYWISSAIYDAGDPDHIRASSPMVLRWRIAGPGRGRQAGLVSKQFTPSRKCRH